MDLKQFEGHGTDVDKLQKLMIASPALLDYARRLEEALEGAAERVCPPKPGFDDCNKVDRDCKDCWLAWAKDGGGEK